MSCPSSWRSEAYRSAAGFLAADRFLSAFVNQQTGGNSWQSLGTFTFTDPSTQGVTLSSDPNYAVAADAVRFVPAGDSVTVKAPSYFHTDQLNTPIRLTNSAQQIVWDASPEPFGKTTPTVAYVTNPLRAPGQYADSETGLSQNWMRDYDPATGRYVESDPIGLDGGLTTYSYVEGNPQILADETGEFANVMIGAAFSVTTGYLLASATGTCYSLEDALVDAGLGALGSGAIAGVARLKKLRDVSKLRALAKERGMVLRKLNPHIEGYTNPANTLERLTIKYSPSLNAPGQLSQNARVEYKIGQKLWQNPFTGEIGKGPEFSHVPIGIPLMENPLASGLAGGSVGATLGQAYCGCE